MAAILMFLASLILHLIVFIGLGMLVWPLVRSSLITGLKQVNYKRKVRMEFLAHLDHKKRSKLFNHLDQLLYLVEKNYDPGISVVRYVFWTIIIALSTFLATLLTLDLKFSFNNPFLEGIQIEQIGGKMVWPFPLTLAMIVIVIRYMYLRIKYAKRSVQGSYDLLEVVKIMAKFSHLNNSLALEQTSRMINDNNVLKRPLLYLSHVFSSYTNEKELTREVQRFSQIVGTTFAISFATDLLYREIEGDDHWLDNLLELSSRMEQQREIILGIRDKNRDAISMGVYVNLLVFVACIGTLIAFVGLPVYIRLQFRTAPGLIMITIIIIGMLASFFISQLLARPKLDYH